MPAHLSQTDLHSSGQVAQASTTGLAPAPPVITRLVSQTTGQLLQHYHLSWQVASTGYQRKHSWCVQYCHHT